ncbi:hypothetical protein [Cellulomonas septica]|uniref:Lipocalin-like domain-containing protein n=1 Tax=Cellulomonas septica TaxID=285080 RepID=A0ABX1K3W5_9CELL|nr:hypothetical protein [Cellulomonas septica]NKY39678.1 hypothetical protein [Cellulomonas septica]
MGCTDTDRPAHHDGGRRSGTAPRVLAAVGTLASLAVVTACTEDVDAAALVGEFVGTTTDGSVRLADDGTFEATAVPLAAIDGADAPGEVDLTGRWELLEISGSDVVYLTIDDVDGATTRTAGAQLWVAGTDRVSLQPDPDRPGTRVEFERRD